MLQKIFISEKSFTAKELKDFKEKHGYNIKEVSYCSKDKQIDFTDLEEKDFLLKYGIPKVLARFGI